MSWLQLHFYADDQWSESIGQELEDIGALAVTTTGNQDQACYEALPSHSAPWQFLRVTGLFPAETAVEPILAHIKKQLPEQSLQDFQVETLQDQDWERTFLASFQPLKVSTNLWVCPSWCTPPEASATVITLDPGLAFGTGTHATTRLCLEWLASANLDKCRVLDYGCGSGILAIGALKLGALHAWGIDIDPRAVSTSLENSSINNTNTNFISGQPSALPGNLSFEVVIANILVNTLIELQSELSARVLENGYLLLSGILESQADEIIKSYGHHFEFQQFQREEWILLVGRKLKSV
ncbi:50S ribosomal protein L11 methyltransferase [Pseudomonadota bacterium]